MSNLTFPLRWAARYSAASLLPDVPAPTIATPILSLSLPPTESGESTLAKAGANFEGAFAIIIYNSATVAMAGFRIKDTETSLHQLQ
jgi:hypothetical protein